MPFFMFDQNNSGGDFHFAGGLAKYVIMEALDASDANARAEAYGLYFDGVEAGRDCNCCGDRWYPKHSDSQGSPVPSVYGETDMWKATADDLFHDEGPSVVIVYDGGIREWFAHKELNPFTYQYDLDGDDVIEDQLAIGA